MSDHGLIEPVPRNFTKEDYWSLWCLFCTTVANQMEPGPAQDRVLSYSFFNERQLGSGHWARSLGNISTKWGPLWLRLSYCTIGISGFDAVGLLMK